MVFFFCENEHQCSLFSIFWKERRFHNTLKYLHKIGHKSQHGCGRWAPLPLTYPTPNYAGILPALGSDMVDLERRNIQGDRETHRGETENHPREGGGMEKSTKGREEKHTSFGTHGHTEVHIEVVPT